MANGWVWALLPLGAGASWLLLFQRSGAEVLVHHQLESDAQNDRASVGRREEPAGSRSLVQSDAERIH